MKHRKIETNKYISKQTIKQIHNHTSKQQQTNHIRKQKTYGICRDKICSWRKKMKWCVDRAYGININTVKLEHIFVRPHFKKFQTWQAQDLNPQTCSYLWLANQTVTEWAKQTARSRCTHLLMLLFGHSWRRCRNDNILVLTVIET